MSLQLVPSSNINSINMNANRLENKVSSGSAFKVYDVQEKVSTKVKVEVFCTTLAGVLAAMAWTFKSKKLPLKNLTDFINNLKNITYNKDKYEVEWLVSRLAIGSVGGGLIGGALFDKKENMNAKYREAIIQVVGNIFTPLICVASGMRLFENYLEPRLLEKFTPKSKIGKGLPGLIASLTCLLTGIIAGNKVGNLINKKIFRVDDQRKIKLSDMSPHIDDACLVTSLVASESKYGPVLSRFIPAALMVAGFSTGVMQERPERLHHKKNEQVKSMEELKVKQSEQAKNN